MFLLMPSPCPRGWYPRQAPSLYFKAWRLFRSGKGPLGPKRFLCFCQMIATALPCIARENFTKSMINHRHRTDNLKI